MGLPYAFGPVGGRKKGERAMKYWIMPYAFGLDKDGASDTEARARLDKALEIVRNQSPLIAPSIFLGAGMEKYAKAHGISSLSHAGAWYLRTRGWSRHQVAMDARGRDTVTEALVLYAYFKEVEKSVIIEVTTSWWHVPRVWAVCRIIFDRPIKVHATRSTHSGFRLLYDIVREAVALPRSVFIAACIKKNEQGSSGLDSALRKMARRL